MKKLKSTFTLLEVIISSVLIAMLISVVYSVFTGGLFIYNRLTKANQLYHSAKFVLQRVHTDLKNMHPVDFSQMSFLGNATSVEFPTLIDAYSLSRDDFSRHLALVRYEVDNAKLIRTHRLDREILKSESESINEIMLEEVQEIQFSYGYLDAETNEVVWVGAWPDQDTQGILPSLVKIMLTLKDNNSGKSIVFEKIVFNPFGS